MGSTGVGIQSAVGMTPGFTNNPGDLYQTYISPGLPSPIMGSPMMGSPYGGMPVQQAPPQGMVWGQMCSNIGFGLLNLSAVMRANMDFNDRSGFKKYRGFRDSDARAVGSDINQRYGSSAGCQKFINKKGEVGPWGRVALKEIEKSNNVEFYETATPRGISKFCPNFNNMDAERRKLFWIWVLASMADPESSCNPREVARGPNGNAVGLFQLDPNACRIMNFHFSESDLQEPSNNIRCAVSRLRRDLECQKTFVTETSYDAQKCMHWGVMRGPTVASVDRSGARKFESLVPQYSDCKAGATGPTAQIEKETRQREQTRQPAETEDDTNPPRRQPAKDAEKKKGADDDEPALLVQPNSEN